MALSREYQTLVNAFGDLAALVDGGEEPESALGIVSRSFHFDATQSASLRGMWDAFCVAQGGDAWKIREERTL